MTKKYKKSIDFFSIYSMIKMEVVNASFIAYEHGNYFRVLFVLKKRLMW